MPATPLAGDNHMPAVALSTFGASQHMAVSPGREQDGILTMPGGQSGHPFSPFYGAGHDDWLKQKPAPLLAGEARHTLTLKRPLNR
jgi:penicillin amidase